jgi:hypothetical protein
MQNNSRRRTPGGIFLLLVKRDDDVQQDKLNLIFSDDRKKGGALKRHSLSQTRKAKAEELRRSLSAGVLFVTQAYCMNTAYFVLSAHSSHNCNLCIMEDRRIGGSISGMGQIFLFPTSPRPELESTHPILWVPEACFCRV